MSNAVLPKAVQKQLDEAQAIERKLAGKQDSTAEVTPEPSTDPQPAAEPAAAEPAAQTPEQPAPEQAPKAADGDAEYWRKRFDTVQGMLNSEAQQGKELSARVNSLVQEIEQLKHKPAEPERKPEALITDKDEEAFGADLIDLARRAARDEFSRLSAGVLDEIRRELAPLHAQLGTVTKRQATTEQDRFYQLLAQTVPEWEQINQDQRWLAWLAEFDPIAGKTRQQALDEAAATLDAQRTAAMFTLFKAQLKPAAGKSAAHEELQRQVTPTKTSASAAVPQAARVWSKAEYERAFDPRTTRSMSQAEVAQLQAEADRAAQEGRIRW